MKNRLILLLLIGSLGLALVGCNVNKPEGKSSNTSTTEESTKTRYERLKEKENQLATPDNIVFFNNGKEITLDSSDEKFNKIVELTKERLKTIEGKCQCAFPVENKEDYSTYEGGVLEFVYLTPQEFSYSLGETQVASASYEKVLFLLGENEISNETMFLYDADDDTIFRSFAPLSSPEDVRKVLTEN